MKVLKKHKLLAVIATVAIVVSTLALVLTNTLAEASWTNFENPHAQLVSDGWVETVLDAKNKEAKLLQFTNSVTWETSDAAVATVSGGNREDGKVTVTAQSAGLVTIYGGTSLGTIASEMIQVVDSSRAAAYKFNDGNEVVTQSGKARELKVETNPTAAKGDFTWYSSNTAVATVAVVDGKVMVTGVASGAAAIYGTITDKYGVENTVIAVAIVDIKLATYGPFGSSNDYYKEVGVPKNVYEVVDANGNSKTDPATYIIDPNGSIGKDLGVDGDETNYEVLKDTDGKFWVKNKMPGSDGKWYPVNDDGTIGTTPGTPGGVTPELPPGTVKGTDNKVYKELSSPKKVWAEVDADGNIVSGGNLVYNPAGMTPESGMQFQTPDVKNVNGGYYYKDNGKWYGINSDGSKGAEADPNKATGFTVGNSSAWKDQNLAVNDSVNFGAISKNPADSTSTLTYVSSNTSVVTVDPVTGVATAKAAGTATIKVVNQLGEQVGSTIAITVPNPITPPNPGQPGDGSTVGTVTNAAGTFIEIARNGGYSLIVRTENVATNVKFNDSGSGNDYNTSTIRTYVNNWWTNTGSAAFPAGKVMQNNVADNKGEWSVANTGFSAPTATAATSTTANAAFLLSYSEAAKFCSRYEYIGGWKDSNSTAITNWGRLSDETSANWWLRSANTSTGDAAIVYYNGYALHTYVSYSSGVRPALWVESSIVNY